MNAFEKTLNEYVFKRCGKKISEAGLPMKVVRQALAGFAVQNKIAFLERSVMSQGRFEEYIDFCFGRFDAGELLVYILICQDLACLRSRADELFTLARKKALGNGSFVDAQNARKLFEEI